jgi:hypothetical protein
MRGASRSITSSEAPTWGRKIDLVDDQKIGACDAGAAFRGVSQASSLSVGVVPRQRPGAPTSIRRSCRRGFFFANRGRAGGDGACGWTSGWRGRGGVRPRGSLLDRRAVAHSGWAALTILAVVTRAREADQAGDLASCERVLGEVQRTIGP